MSLFDEVTIAFIGAGVMGGTMISGMVKGGLVEPQQIIAADTNEQRGAQLVSELGIRFTLDNAEAAQQADMLVIGVKPQQIDKALQPLRGHVDAIPVVVSIVAGTKIRDISERLHNSRIVRVMPNTPGQIAQGMSAWTATYEVDDLQRQQTKALLDTLGESLYVDDENYIDMATAINGSGPGYVFLIIEAMIDAAVQLGFSRKHAEQLVLQTLKGSVNYAIESGVHPTILRNQVTSPGGTTAAGLAEMERHGLRTALAEGIKGSYRRAVELGEKDDKG